MHLSIYVYICVHTYPHTKCVSEESSYLYIWFLPEPLSLFSLSLCVEGEELDHSIRPSLAWPGKNTEVVKI